MVPGPSERASKATTPSDRFADVHWATLGNGRTVWHELNETSAAAYPKLLDDTGFVGDVLGLLRSAAHGRLPEGNPDVLEPVRTNPYLWELKWKRRKKKREFRAYYAEPEQSPDFVVLLFHEKDVSSQDQPTIDALQQGHIDKAGERHEEGLDRRWGHRKKACHDCVKPEAQDRQA
ncbi:hypothetical protein [Sinomonas sp. RB5]